MQIRWYKPVLYNKVLGLKPNVFYIIDQSKLISVGSIEQDDA